VIVEWFRQPSWALGTRPVVTATTAKYEDSSAAASVSVEFG
jgi:hypothetical protein